MAADLIRYDLLVQDAIRGVVRRVLTDAVRDGMPGEHHFYITFKTKAPGVRLSARMREQYPDEMTIVLQHQFWDLAVSEHAFEVGLSFQGKSESLLIPFEALTGFSDPTVPFSFKFEFETEAEEANANEVAPTGDTPKPSISSGVATLPTRPHDAAASAASAAKATDEQGEGTKIVSIDAFRKKT
jgi:hypothetical protein